MKKTFAILFATAIFCGCSTVHKTVPPVVSANDAPKIELRNNAASLLDDLLNDEKNVSKVLLVKSHSDELGALIKLISQISGDSEKQLQTLAENDPTLRLHALQLPPGETAVRAAVAKTEEHELLFTSGGNFEFNLLLTQAQALNYGSHLAKVASENSPTPEQARTFHALDLKFADLFQQVVNQMRSLPPK